MKVFHKSGLIIFLVFLVCFSEIAFADSGKPWVGVYYFPGWLPNSHFLPYKDQWAKFKNLPGRQPLMGWYDDTDPSVIQRQVNLIANAGINTIIFDWYYSAEGKVELEQPLRNYLEQADKRGVDFSIMWANHDVGPRDFSEWVAIIDYWIDRYFSNENYRKFNGKPIVFIFSIETLSSRAAAFGYGAARLLNFADAVAKARGLNGIYFVGLSDKTDFDLHALRAEGYSAISAYNYNAMPDKSRLTHGYAELDHAYRYNWKKLSGNSVLPYIIPTTSGWDLTPWGGSADVRHDNSIASPSEYEAHLRAAKSMAKPWGDYSGAVVLCCWNEWGEGSFIEPSIDGGASILSKVPKVFR